MVGGAREELERGESCGFDQYTLLPYMKLSNDCKRFKKRKTFLHLKNPKNFSLNLHEPW